jgi:hypothetical protein
MTCAIRVAKILMSFPEHTIPVGQPKDLSFEVAGQLRILRPPAL